VIAKGLRDCGRAYGDTLKEASNLILECTSQGGHIRYYAKDVYQEYRRQNAAVEIGGAADEMVTTPEPDDVLEQLPQIATRYASLPANRTAENAEVMEAIIAEMEGRHDADRFQFGIGALDSIINGVPPSALVTVGARTSNGKSVFLGQCAIQCAERDRKPALFFSLEMGAAELYKRWASLLSRQPTKGGVRRQFLGGLSHVDELLRADLLHVFTGPRNVEQITADAMSYATRCELGLIAVDYLQAVVPSNTRNEGREQQVAHIASSLKHLASKAGVPVLTASQLNKTGEQSPGLSSIRESEAIANYSNIVLFLDPADQHCTTTQIDIHVAKSRDGAKGVVTAMWERPIYTIRDQDVYDMANHDPQLQC
jgi:replicative DNA helicase